jgi:hypothetical protein
MPSRCTHGSSVVTTWEAARTSIKSWENLTAEPGDVTKNQEYVCVLSFVNNTIWSKPLPLKNAVFKKNSLDWDVCHWYSTGLACARPWAQYPQPETKYLLLVSHSHLRHLVEALFITAESFTPPRFVSSFLMVRFIVTCLMFLGVQWKVAFPNDPGSIEKLRLCGGKSLVSVPTVSTEYGQN